MKNDWVQIDGGKEDGNRITVEVDHFTMFAVMAAGPEEEQPSSDQPGPDQQGFSDISGHWAESDVHKAVQSGIANGYSDGSFRSAAEITRTEMAIMIAKALALKVEDNTLTGFEDDAQIPNWANGQVAALQNLSLISGKGNNKFAPHNTATKAETVAVLLKITS